MSYLKDRYQGDLGLLAKRYKKMRHASSQQANEKEEMLGAFVCETYAHDLSIRQRKFFDHKRDANDCTFLEHLVKLFIRTKEEGELPGHYAISFLPAHRLLQLLSVKRLADADEVQIHAFLGDMNRALEGLFRIEVNEELIPFEKFDFYIYW